MAIRTDSITSAEWSITIGNPGEVVEGLEDIDQCIAIILATRKGSDPHRPLFGCDAWKYLDTPILIAIPNIIREAVDSLEEWEPRIDLVSVKARIDGSRLIIVVEWQPKGDTALSTATSEVSLGATA